MERKIWEEKSNVTIPLEYFDHLRWAQETYFSLWGKIESCFEWDEENERCVVNIGRLVEVVCPEHFDGVETCYDNVNQD
jgi:hypothetical protein